MIAGCAHTPMDRCRGGSADDCDAIGRAALEHADAGAAADAFALGCTAGRAADCWEAGRLEADPFRALQLYERACPQIRSACNSLGLLLVRGPGAHDPQRAQSLFRDACEEIPEACNNLGMVLLDAPTPIVRDAIQAALLFQQACDRGAAQGCMNVGLMLSRGDGLKQDLPRARAILRKACAAGSYGACQEMQRIGPKSKH